MQKPNILGTSVCTKQNLITICIIDLFFGGRWGENDHNLHQKMLRIP